MIKYDTAKIISSKYLQIVEKLKEVSYPASTIMYKKDQI